MLWFLGIFVTNFRAMPDGFLRHISNTQNFSLAWLYEFPLLAFIIDAAMSFVIAVLPFLFLMVLASFVFLDLPQVSKISESQRRDQQKISIVSAIAYILLFFLLLFIAMIGPFWIFLVSLIPIPFTIALLYYRWKYHHDIPKVRFIIVIVALLIFSTLLSIGAYYMQVNMRHNLPEQLPPAVPPPVNLTPPPIASPAVPDPDE